MKKIISILVIITFFFLPSSEINGFGNSNEMSRNLMYAEPSSEGSAYDEVENRLIQSVPELSEYRDYISEKSGGSAYQIIQVFPESKVDFSDGKDADGFFFVYVGEQWEDHRANWDWFCVSKDLKEVLWYCLPENKTLSLEEWRNSAYYRVITK